MTKTYQGSCHCGAVRYEAAVDLDRTFKCNCSICAKGRSWITMVKPEDFRILAGEEELTDYQFGRKNIHHLFCRHCGIHPFGWGNSPDLGGKAYAVNIMSLDGVPDADLAAAKIRYFDGRNNDWQAAPAETRYL